MTTNQGVAVLIPQACLLLGGVRVPASARSVKAWQHAQVVEVKERDVTITDLELSRQPGSRDVSFRVGCSKGTYIRSLVNDIVRLTSLELFGVDGGSWL